MTAETSQTLGRGLRVLEVLAATPNGLTITALATEVGVNRTVVYRLVATDTIEEKVMALKARKAELFAKVIDGGGTTATGITADDIRGLFD